MSPRSRRFPPGPNLTAALQEQIPGCCAFCDEPLSPYGRITCGDPVCHRAYVVTYVQDRRRAGIPDSKGKSNCSFEGCDRSAIANGLCQAHYMQLRRGVKLRPLLPARWRGPIGPRKEE